MSDGIVPRLNNWNQPDREQTSRHAEFGSTGPEQSPMSE
jgi:hypothetical protein